MPDSSSTRLLDTELLRSTSATEIQAARDVLKLAGIACRIAGTKAGFDIMEIGRDGGPSDHLLLVAAGDLKQASEAMEASFANTPLPEGHFLATATDEEVLEVLAAPEDWSFFDLAYARRLARERQINAADVAGKRTAHVAELKEGRPAPAMLVRLGWILALTGSGLGILIGVALVISTEKTPHGEFPKYDRASRESGASMAFVSVVVAIGVGLLLTVFASR